MKIPVSVRVNGVDTENEVEPRLLLVHYLRDVLGLTGTNVGCDTSQCGSCTILVDGDAIKSCTVLAVQADGSDKMLRFGSKTTFDQDTTDGFIMGINASDNKYTCYYSTKNCGEGRSAIIKLK